MESPNDSKGGDASQYGVAGPGEEAESLVDEVNPNHELSRAPAVFAQARRSHRWSAMTTVKGGIRGFRSKRRRR